MKILILVSAFFAFSAQAAYIPKTVTSAGSKQRIEGALVNTTCSSTPCTITSQSGTWISSITRGGTGAYTVNFVAGTWSTAPYCHLTSDWAPGYYSSMPTTSAVVFQVSDTGGTARDSKFTVTCFGAR